MKTKVKTDDFEHIRDLQEADSVLAEISSLQREVKRIELSANEQIDQIKADADARITPLKAELTRLEKGLAYFAAENRNQIFAKGMKSVEMVFGVIGFRQATSLKTLSKWTWKKVLGALLDGRHFDAVHIKQSPNKEILSQWTDEKLAAVGVKRDIADHFWYEVKEEELEAAK